MEKLKINVRIVTDNLIFKNEQFIFFTPQKNNLEKFFSINEQSNITNINYSELGYLDVVRPLNENFLNLKQYKLELF